MLIDKKKVPHTSVRKKLESGNLFGRVGRLGYWLWSDTQGLSYPGVDPKDLTTAVDLTPQFVMDKSNAFWENSDNWT